MPEIAFFVILALLVLLGATLGFLVLAIKYIDYITGAKG